MICPAERQESLVIHRDTTAFAPDSIDDYFEEHVLAAETAEAGAVEEICDRDR